MARYLEHGRFVHDSEGRRLLRVYLQTHSRHDLARYLAVHVSDISRWLSGKTQPTTALILLRLQAIGIPVESWCNVQTCTAESVTIETSAAPDAA